MPKLGRKPPKRAPALRLSSLLSGVIPDHPAAVDYLNLGGWQMLGNDQWRDCVAVTWANDRRLMSHVAGHETYPTVEEVLAFYETQNPGFPGQDDGMEIQTALEALVRDGGPDGVKAVAFANVNHANPDEVKAAVAIFGQVWVGINVQNANQDDFSSGRPWDYHPASGIEGGHSVVAGGYDSDRVGGDEDFITWARETSFTDRFWSELVEECWVVVWPEHFTTAHFLAGIDTERLAAAYLAITGRVLPVPVTPPKPPGAASFLDSDPALAARVDHAAGMSHEDRIPWLLHHLRAYFRMEV